VRGAFEAALRRGGIVVAFDGARLRLLPDCRAPGRYGYMPTVPAERPLQLEGDDVIAANFPLASAPGLPPPAGPRRLDRPITVAGSRDLGHGAARAALAGACADATHVVRRVVVGFLGERKAATACDGGPANAAGPPPGCDRALRLVLEPLDAPPLPEALAAAGERCPAGFTETFDVCVRARPDLPYACSPRDLADCARQCDRQHARSCETLGFLLRAGIGAAVDRTRAAASFARACDLGSAEGCANLGLAARAGDGAPRDPGRAAALLARGCELGHAGACVQLGLLYEVGHGVPRDRERAAMMYARACTAAHGLGCRSLAGAALHGLGVPRDPARARALLARSCELGERTGCLFLGVMLRDGLGGPPEAPRGQALIHAACEEGVADACAEERRP
jgi:hypothetical protein